MLCNIPVTHHSVHRTTEKKEKLCVTDGVGNLMRLNQSALGIWFLSTIIMCGVVRKSSSSKEEEDERRGSASRRSWLCWRRPAERSLSPACQVVFPRHLEGSWRSWQRQLVSPRSAESTLAPVNTRRLRANWGQNEDQ